LSSPGTVDPSADTGVLVNVREPQLNVKMRHDAAAHVGRGKLGAECGRLGGKRKRKMMTDDALTYPGSSTSTRKPSTIPVKRDDPFGCLARLQVCNEAAKLRERTKKVYLEAGQEDVECTVTDSLSKHLKRTKRHIHTAIQGEEKWKVWKLENKFGSGKGGSRNAKGEMQLR
jgi:hypothetical protein